MRPFLLSLIFLFSFDETSSKSLCSQKDMKVISSHLTQIKQKFHEETNNHFKFDINSLSPEEFKKRPHLKGYKKPSIKVYSNPRNKLQKIVYIEYEKNWWGSLYFTLFKDEKISKWTKIATHGATTICVRWNEKDFFYEDSTHMGSKTKNTCFLKSETTIHCKRHKPKK